MQFSGILYVLIFAVVGLSPCNGQSADFSSSTALFVEGFESELSSQAQPVWAWKKPYDPVKSALGMMYGRGDIFERSTTVAHSGLYSLRLNLAGRNAVCNMCGLAGTLRQSATADGVRYFVDSAGQDLSAAPFNEPDSRRYVYDKSDRFSRWVANAVTNENATGDRLDFVRGAPQRNAMRGTARFHAGDSVEIYRACGVDGTVGKRISRRSDCNLAINYLQNINPSRDFPPGGSLFRRFYFYVPSNTVLPEITLKLGYMHFKYSGKDGGVQVIVVSTQRGGDIESEGSFGFFSSHIQIKRDRWYYVEEQFRRESAVGASDGQYRLWVAEDGSSSGSPVVQKNGLPLQEILSSSGGGMSIGGNWQHYTDSSGFIYFDDIEISRGRVGVR
jgi:hypothetical protein